MVAGSRVVRREKKWDPRLLCIAVTILAAFVLSALVLCGTASASDGGLEKYEGIDGKAGLQSTAAADDGSLSVAAATLYQQNDARYYYWGAWTSATDRNASGGSYWFSNSDSSILVVFLGTHLTWYAKAGPTNGKAKAHVDGSNYETVDLYSSTVRYGEVWDTGVLDYGVHSVEIEWTGTKNASATGTSISVDAFMIDGPLLDADGKGTGTISGTVKNSSGTGVAGVYVTAMNLALGPVGVTVTRSNGSYSLTELPNELVVVQTYNLKDYIDEWYNDIPYPGHVDASGATWLNLAATPSRTGINFSLAAGRSISGYVRDAHSNPLFNQEVDVYDLSGSLVNSMPTDGNGFYSFQGLPAGQYRVCTLNDLGYVDEWYDNHPVISDPDGSFASIVDIRTSNATGKDFALETGRTIAGRVYGPSGALADVEVRVQPSTGGISLYAWTDSTGLYQMEGLPPGLYAANTANDQGYVDEWYNNDPAPADLFGENAQDIDVTAGDQLAINFALDEGYTISGYVTDYETKLAVPDPGVYVEIYDGAGKLYSYSMVGGAAGTRYESWALPAGTYYVKTSDDYFLGYVNKWYPNKPCWLYTLSDAAPVVLSTADVGSINFDMEWMNLYEQTDPHIYYTPAWTLYSAPLASGGSYSYSSATNATATIFFYGNRLDAIVMKGTTTGSADFLVDGVKTDTINLAAAAPTYNVKVFTTGILPSGPHKVEIKYTSTNASGKRITLDAVEVAGELTYAVPMITSVTPNTGYTLGGDSVVITGTNLGAAASVTFGNMLATITSNSATQIVAVTPAHAAGPVRVQVTTSAGTTTDTPADDFTYLAPGVPTITSLSPSTGSIDGGTSVTITGTNFAGLSGSSAVTFGGVDAKSYVRVSATTITAVAPVHTAGTARVEVTAFGGTTTDTDKDDFTYTETPPVTRYDQLNNANIVKTGSWLDYTSPGSYKGSYARSLTSSASVTVWFTGTQIAYMVFKGTTTGYADVYIDNVKQTTVNLTASRAHLPAACLDQPGARQRPPQLQSGAKQHLERHHQVRHPGRR